MLPLLLAQAALGGYSAWNKFQQGKSAQAQAEKARKRLDVMMSENRQDQEKVTQQAAADATDVRTNYITARDPNKAQGLAQMYQSGMNNFRNAITGLKQENRVLQAQREEIKSPTNAEIYGGVAADLAGTAFNMYGTYKAEQAADMAQHNQNEFMSMLSDPTHKYVKPVQKSFGEQLGNEISSGLQSFKNMFGDSNFTPKLDSNWKAPNVEILEMPEKRSPRPTYESGATKFYDDAFLKSDKWKRMKGSNLQSSFSSQLQFRSLGGF